MATSIENLKVGAKYRVKKGSETVVTGTFTRRLTIHPYGHKGRPVEIEEDDGQAGFYSEEEGYTFEEVKGGRRRTKKSKRRARKTRRRYS
jgi:hypothetical protein